MEQSSTLPLILSPDDKCLYKIFSHAKHNKSQGIQCIHLQIIEVVISIHFSSLCFLPFLFLEKASCLFYQFYPFSELFLLIFWLTSLFFIFQFVLPSCPSFYHLQKSFVNHPSSSLIVIFRLISIEWIYQCFQSDQFFPISYNEPSLCHNLS